MHGVVFSSEDFKCRMNVQLLQNYIWHGQTTAECGGKKSEKTNISSTSSHPLLPCSLCCPCYPSPSTCNTGCGGTIRTLQFEINVYMGNVVSLFVVIIKHVAQISEDIIEKKRLGTLRAIQSEPPPPFLSSTLSNHNPDTC